MIRAQLPRHRGTQQHAAKSCLLSIRLQSPHRRSLAARVERDTKRSRPRRVRPQRLQSDDVQRATTRALCAASRAVAASMELERVRQTKCAPRGKNQQEVFTPIARSGQRPSNPAVIITMPLAHNTPAGMTSQVGPISKIHMTKSRSPIPSTNAPATMRSFFPYGSMLQELLIGVQL